MSATAPRESAREQKQLYLDRDRRSHEEIDPIGAVDPHSLVVDRKWKLPGVWHVPQTQLPAEALLIRRLQESRPERPMHLDRRPDDLPRNLVHPPRIPRSPRNRNLCTTETQRRLAALARNRRWPHRSPRPAARCTNRSDRRSAGRGDRSHCHLRKEICAPREESSA